MGLRDTGTQNMLEHLMITLSHLYDLQTLAQHNKPRLALINLFGGVGWLRLESSDCLGAEIRLLLSRWTELVE